MSNFYPLRKWSPVPLSTETSMEAIEAISGMFSVTEVIPHFEIASPVRGRDVPDPIVADRDHRGTMYSMHK